MCTLSSRANNSAFVITAGKTPPNLLFRASKSTAQGTFVVTGAAVGPGLIV
ncbi:MAG: hypothetical protein IPL31_16460 [Saprospiraceae bacterium]|nr:hypothetical protein [Saprospiraceae bacterium]